jgi:hypothetical protein
MLALTGCGLLNGGSGRPAPPSGQLSTRGGMNAPRAILHARGILQSQGLADRYDPGSGVAYDKGSHWKASSQPRAPGFLRFRRCLKIKK